MKIVSRHKFEDIIGVENILEAWKEFVKGKRKKKDVQEFQLNLMDNILGLHQSLKSFKYEHGGYKAFKINDPKPRNIHKASVRDRLLHHAIYRILYPFFDRTFISDSFSCRNSKGIHKALNRFRSFAYKVSKNHTKTCWILKCDIRKFFENINHDILLDMNEFDQFVKHKLKIKYYIRYADDFVILSENKSQLESKIEPIKNFLSDKLKLELHSDKIFIKTFASGVDFLGWVHFTDHRILRTTTKRRMFKRLKESSMSGTLNSYLGLIKHGNTEKIRRKFT